MQSNNQPTKNQSIKLIQTSATASLFATIPQLQQIGESNPCFSSGSNNCATATTTMNSWLRFHSYDPKAHEEKKRRTREQAKKNKFNGLHFRPSKYMLSESSKEDQSLNRKEKETCLLQNMSIDNLHLYSESPSLIQPLLTHTFQVASILSETTISTCNQSQTKSKRTTTIPSRLTLPSIHEILSLSKIEKPTHTMNKNNSLHLAPHYLLKNSTSFESLTLPPFKVSI